MKFSIVPLEDRIAPSRSPFQQAIVAGGGKGSKGGAGLTMAQQGNGGAFGSTQQAIVAGGGKGSKGGAGLIMAQQGSASHPTQVYLYPRAERERHGYRVCLRPRH